jgi:hypothetical protein
MTTLFYKKMKLMKSFVIGQNILEQRGLTIIFTILVLMPIFSLLLRQFFCLLVDVVNVALHVECHLGNVVQLA